MQCFFCGDRRVVLDNHQDAHQCPHCAHLVPPPVPVPEATEEAERIFFRCGSCTTVNYCRYVDIGNYNEHRELEPDDEGQNILWIGDTYDTRNLDPYDARFECRNCGEEGALEPGWHTEWT